MILSATASMLVSIAMMQYGANVQMADVHMVSRANCATFNESITYSRTGVTWNFRTNSTQRNLKTNSTRSFFDSTTGPRSYAGCQGCGGMSSIMGGWIVNGTHIVGPALDQTQQVVLEAYCGGGGVCGLTTGLGCY